MSDFNIDAGELASLAADLGKASGAVTKQAQQAVRKAAFDVEAKAKAAAPVKTGNLRNSISTTVKGGGLEATIGPTASYGVFVELGTRSNRPQPFLQPAADAVMPELAQAFEQLGGDLL